MSNLVIPGNCCDAPAQCSPNTLGEKYNSLYEKVNHSLAEACSLERMIFGGNEPVAKKPEEGRSGLLWAMDELNALADELLYILKKIASAIDD